RVRGRDRARDPRARLRRRSLRRDARVLRVGLARLSAPASGRAARAPSRPLRALRAAQAPRGDRLGDAGAHARAARPRVRGRALEGVAPRRVARRPRLVAGGDAARLWFVEDRIRTLEDVKQDEALAGAKLFLAAWGYTTADDREAAQRDARIVLLTLARFARDFPAWSTPGDERTLTRS